MLDQLAIGQAIGGAVVALSSCEAEYIAAIQALWLARLLDNLLGRKAKVAELRVDDKFDLALAENHVFMGVSNTSR